MKTCNLPFRLIVAVLAVIACMGAADAATSSPDQGIDHTRSQIRHEGFGVLKAVNMDAGKVQIAHAAISSLNWPAMTMWFSLQGPLPKEIKVGDSVSFELKQTPSKEWAITRIERNR